MKKLLAVLLFLVAFASASEVFFDSRFTLWKDATILIWSLDGNSPISTNEFCLSLRRNNTGIGEPKCRELGEWERDTIATRYGTWLSNNLEKGLPSSYLRARHPGMAAKIQVLEDNIVLFLAPQGKFIQVAVFDETAQEPKAAGIVKANSDKIALGDDIAATFFDKRTKRRLTKEERLKMQTEPDDLYKEVPNLKAIRTRNCRSRTQVHPRRPRARICRRKVSLVPCTVYADCARKRPRLARPLPDPPDVASQWLVVSG